MNKLGKIGRPAVLDKPYYPAIDGLRALAVFCVIFFHLELSLFSGGFVGVDVFFVVSGYLISRNILVQLDANKFSFKKFYISRFRRLLPALFFTISVSLIMGCLLYSPDALIRLSSSAIAGVASIANIRYWMNSGYFDIDSASKPLLHLWSLSVEEQFYIIWPMVLIICFKVLSHKRVGIFFLAALTMCSYAAATYYVEYSPETAFFWMPFRAYEFSIGALLAVHEVRHHKDMTPALGSNSVLTLFGVLLIIAPAVFYNEVTTFPGHASLLPCLGALIVLVAKDSHLARLILANRVSVFFGKISYSLYLVHWPVWVFISFWYFNPFNIPQKMGIFLIILLLGFCVYFFIEERFRYNNTKGRDSVFFVGLFIVAAGTVSIAQSIRINKGLPGRIETVEVKASETSNISCEYPKQTKVVKACAYGDQTAPQTHVLVVGDSHSMNLLSGLDRFGQHNSVSFTSYSVAGCPPLLGVEIRVENQLEAVQDCKNFSQHLLALLSNPEFDVILMSARWMWLHEDTEYHATQVPPLVHLSEESGDLLNDQLASDLWKRSLENTIEYAKDHEKKVVLFSQYPLLNKGIGECNKSPQYLIAKDAHANRCRPQIPYDRIMSRLSHTNKTIMSFSSDTVLTILPSDELCDNDTRTCNILTQQGLLYHDGDHLSAAGAIYLIDSVSDRLTRFLHD